MINHARAALNEMMNEERNKWSNTNLILPAIVYPRMNGILFTKQPRNF